MIEPVTDIESKPPFSTIPSEQSATISHFTFKRILLFSSVILTILLSTNAFVCATWSYFFGTPGWMVWQALPAIASVAFVFATILRFRSVHPAVQIVYALSATWVGALNFACFAAAGCWIAEVGFWLARSPSPHFIVAAILFGIAFAATVYGLINARSIRITRITIQLPGLPEKWHGQTAALVSDLHLSALFGARFLRRVISRLRALNPEIVFISGDMFDGSTLGLDQLVAPWREFSTRRGIFYVTGNHDEFGNRNIFLHAVERTGIQVLNNEKTTIDGLQIVGVHDSEAVNPAELRAILRHLQLDRKRPSILLAHQPIHLSVAEEEGISLQLSGHTHGGQIWPWNLLVSRIYGPFAYGFSRFKKLQVYTSSGVGTWGPPLRVGTKSEIVLMRFEKEPEQNLG